MNYKQDGTNRKRIDVVPITKIGNRLFVLTPGDMTSDFMSGSFGFRRVLRFGTPGDARAATAELKYLLRLARRRERRDERNAKKAAA